ncbi:hypothetical protein Y032_0119g809 [Ancylostoma ceylanicum]|nr:hypothetical protein Y032_0119g809 [Ancylostoma ceylanicum]
MNNAAILHELRMEMLQQQFGQVMFFVLEREAHEKKKPKMRRLSISIVILGSAQSSGVFALLCRTFRACLAHGVKSIVDYRFQDKSVRAITLQIGEYLRMFSLEPFSYHWKFL